MVEEEEEVEVEEEEEVEVEEEEEEKEEVAEEVEEEGGCFELSSVAKDRVFFSFFSVVFWYCPALVLLPPSLLTPSPPLSISLSLSSSASSNLPSSYSLPPPSLPSPLLPSPS